MKTNVLPLMFYSYELFLQLISQDASPQVEMDNHCQVESYPKKQI